MIKVYLASRYSRRPEMEGYARQLQGLGYTIGSQWVWGNRNILGNLPEAKRFCILDREDILKSDLVINFAEPKEVDYPRGSRHTEFGMAYERGKVCYVVGKFDSELENIFHNLDGVVIFHSWETLFAHLEQLIVFERARDTMRAVIYSVAPVESITGNGERKISDPGYAMTGIADRDNQDLK